jgi:hypothetical protein
MKKFMLSLFFMVGIFVLASQGEMLWSNRLLLDETRVHKIQKGESLSRLAKRYYGDPHRWRELALVNRAPNPNLVLPGEEVLVPAVGPINEMRRARTITAFNSLVDEQERLAVAESPAAADKFSGSTPSAPTNEPEPSMPAATEVNDETPVDGAADGMETAPEPVAETPLTDETEADAGFPWFWLAVGVILIAGVFAFMRYRQRAEPEETAGEESDDRLTRPEQMLRERRRSTESVSTKA